MPRQAVMAQSPLWREVSFDSDSPSSSDDSFTNQTATPSLTMEQMNNLSIQDEPAASPASEPRTKNKKLVELYHFTTTDRRHKASRAE